MENSWIIDISVNNETEMKQICLSTTNNRQRLYLNSDVLQSSAEALFYMDEDELMIECIGNADVIVKRGVRERTLSHAHPMRILPSDRIRIGVCEYCIENIHHQNISSRNTFTHLANKAIFAGAAALMLASVPACTPKSVPANSSLPAAEQNDNDVKKDVADDTAAADSDVKKDAVDDTAAADSDVKKDTANDELKCDTPKVLCLNNNRYEQCENQPWKLVEACKAPSLCKVNDEKTSTFCENAEPCKDGTYACFGGSLKCEKNPGIGCHRDDQIYKCKDQKWVLETQCPSDKGCELQSDNKTAVCLEYPHVVGKMAHYNECKYDEVKCDSNAIMNCKIGKWHYDKVCPEGEACQVNDNGRASCVSENK